MRARADRVEQAEFEIGRCPVCTEKIAGNLTVAVTIDTVDVGRKMVPADYGTRDEPQVRVRVRSKFRGMHIEHRCESSDGPEIEEET